MAVIVKYTVVRDGEEKMTFATKKEADAYDKMLDIADNLYDFLDRTDLKLDETLQEELSLLMARRRDEVMPILRGISPKKIAPSKAAPAKPSAKATAKQAPSAKPAAKPSAKAPAKNPPKAKAAAGKKRA